MAVCQVLFNISGRRFFSTSLYVMLYDFLLVIAAICRSRISEETGSSEYRSLYEITKKKILQTLLEFDREPGSCYSFCNLIGQLRNN